MPPKPNTAATIATIKKIIDHLSIIVGFKGLQKGLIGIDNNYSNNDWLR